MPVHSPSTSLSLLERLRDRSDAGAWERLVTIYTPLMRSWFRDAGRQSADADDLGQRVFEVLLRRLPSFEHNGRPGAFRAWLRGIATNVLREAGRARSEGESDSSLDELPDLDEELTKIWDAEHDRHVLQTVLKLVQPEFTQATWQAFLRVTLGGAKPAEVAVDLGITVNAVLIAKCRVLARLREEARGLVD